MKTPVHGITGKTAAGALLAVLGLAATTGLEAQAAGEAARSGPAADLPLRRIALFSSGVAYYEHSGTVSGPSVVRLPFRTEAVNDALKSLVILDPASAGGEAPRVSYPSEQTLAATLGSLLIDLSGNPDLASILASMRGAEIEITAPSSIRGRIIGIEYKSAPVQESRLPAAAEPWLIIFTASGLRSVNLKDIATVNFPDPRVGADLNRALDLLAASGNSTSRELTLNLGGGESRSVSASYVISAPVWKVSYRLDLASGDGAFLQGWAIVDNDSDSDWKNVELSLVAGRPVSFIQNLYPPFYISRPVLPLAIAGTAEAKTYDSGYAWDDTDFNPESPSVMEEQSIAPAMRARAAPPMNKAMADTVADYGALAAEAQAAGDQFEFTIRDVTLDRRMSAMLPMVQARPPVRKLLVLSGADMANKIVHPRLGAEITNTTDIQFPAGPVTVYDGGTYAGDALIEFLSGGEKRLLSYGEDLSVTAISKTSVSRVISAAAISGGVMTVSRRELHERTYTVKNNTDQTRELVIEHPITAGAELSREKPEQALSSKPVILSEPEEKTQAVYRFIRSIGAGSESVFSVHEEIPLSERITLSALRTENLLSYASTREIPESVRRALREAVSLKQAADAAKEEETAIADRRERLISEQARIRANLEAAGNTTPQGQEYLRRLSTADAGIDSLLEQLEQAEKTSRTAREAFENYLASLAL
ncbi:MAG: DUF4139 domain-containing protein [Treponema sp.]|jgi:hypothetical protein|nr:DUF4139 domain-containing protein [Treponema sp.]